MREEERQVSTEARDALIPKGEPAENPRHPPKLPPPNQDQPQVAVRATTLGAAVMEDAVAKKAAMEAPKAKAPMDVPATASSATESPTTTVDLNLMKPDTTEEVAKEEPLPQFILAPAFMDIVCPECGALLQGASPTNLKHRQLQHPFGDPPLGGSPCRFKGRLFKTPVVRIDLL